MFREEIWHERSRAKSDNFDHQLLLRREGRAKQTITTSRLGRRRFRHCATHANARVCIRTGAVEWIRHYATRTPSSGLVKPRCSALGDNFGKLHQLTLGVATRVIVYSFPFSLSLSVFFFFICAMRNERNCSQEKNHDLVYSEGF